MLQIRAEPGNVHNKIYLPWYIYLQQYIFLFFLVLGREYQHHGSEISGDEQKQRHGRCSVCGGVATHPAARWAYDMRSCARPVVLSILSKR